MNRYFSKQLTAEEKQAWNQSLGRDIGSQLSSSGNASAVLIAQDEQLQAQATQTFTAKSLCRTPDAWTYDDLRNPSAARKAQNLAEIAEVMLIVSADGAEPPLAVREWFERVLCGRNVLAGRVIGLVKRPSIGEEMCPFHEFLFQVTHKHGMRFIPGVLPTAEQESQSPAYDNAQVAFR